MGTPFKTKQTRPTSLLNQGCCFSDDEVSEILALRDQDLTFSEYRTLFDLSRCVGTYDQLVYFLPLALQYIKENPGDGFECLSQVIHFVSAEVGLLKRDGLIDPSRREMRLWFEQWTKSFTVQHYDKQACRQKGWVIEYDDIVHNSQLVSELIDDLVRFRTHADLAEEMVQSLARPAQDYTRSAWFLEYARQVRTGYLDLEAQSNLKIHRLIADNQLLQCHYDLILNTVVAQEESPTFWSDLRKALNLESA